MSECVGVAVSLARSMVCFHRCVAQISVLLLLLFGYGANAQTLSQQPHTIIFEVAPDPHEAVLLQHWRRLSSAQRHDISIAVANRVVPVVLRHHRASGVLVQQIGSYLDDTNVSFALHLEDGDSLEVAGALACTLGQDSVLVMASQPFAGSRYHDAINISVGEKNLEQIDQIYRRLRHSIGVQLIDGQTTSHGAMTILLPPGADVSRSVTLMKTTLGNAYEIQTVGRHAALADSVVWTDPVSSDSTSESVDPGCDSFKAQAITEWTQALH